MPFRRVRDTNGTSPFSEQLEGFAALSLVDPWPKPSVVFID